MPRVPTSKGYEIGFVDVGGGDATPIVFLHGVGSDKSVWHPQLAHFGRSRRAIAFDYPGYGDSDPAPTGTTRDDYAAAVLSAMTALGVPRAHVCGLSLGGVRRRGLSHPGELRDWLSPRGRSACTAARHGRPTRSGWPSARTNPGTGCCSAGPTCGPALARPFFAIVPRRGIPPEEKTDSNPT